jgi:hypothetical protein
MKGWGAVVMLAVVGLIAAPRAAGDLTGYVSDLKCATSGAKAKTAAEWIKPAAFESCVKDCVKQGSEAVFVTEDNRILKFDAASHAKIHEFLGKKVKVSGTVTGDVLSVASLTAVKMQ